MMKRKLAALLLSALLVPSLAACSDDGGTAVETTTGASVETEAVVTTEPLTEDGLPFTDFEGEEFRVYVRDINLHMSHAAEMNGEVVNDAVYTANHNVAERYNVALTFTPYETTVNSLDTTIGKMIYAGDDSFDLVSCHDNTMALYSLAGYLLNVNKLPYIDYSQPWWPINNVKSMTVNGTMHLISNSMSYSNLSQTNAVFMNKTLLGDYGIDLPYQTVLDGDWTLDHFISLTKDVYSDVNGNGERDDGDLYGFCGQTEGYRIIESFDLQTYKRDAEDNLIIDINNERTISFIEKFHSLCYESTGGDMVVTTKDVRSRFVNNNLLFGFITLTFAVDELRHTEIDYGFLPMPKLDDVQEGYLSGSNDTPFGVPVTNKRHEMTGFMIEALSAEGYRTIQPAYFEIALKQKFTTDEESMQMLDIISSSRVIDFGYIYSGAAHPLNRIIYKLFPSKDFASFYEANIEGERAQLAIIIEAFEQYS